MLNKYVYIGLSKAVCLGSGVLNKMSCVLKKKKKKETNFNSKDQNLNHLK